MFNRAARRFTDIYPKEPERFGADDYAAKWLTRVYHPEFGDTIRISFPKDVPHAGSTGSLSWRGADVFCGVEEVF